MKKFYEENKTIIWVVVGVIILLIISASVAHAAKRKSIITGIDSTGTSSPTTVKYQESAFPLKEGSRGKQVVQVQRWLNANTGSFLVEDGIWGPKTQAAFEDACITENLVSTACVTEITESTYNYLDMANA